MLKLFRLSCENKMPILYHKAKSKNDALKMFHKGFDDKTFMEYFDDPNFKIEEMTSIEMLMEKLPDEFQIGIDTSF